MGQTALGSLLKAIGNSGQGKVVPGWGAVPCYDYYWHISIDFPVILLKYITNHYYYRDFRLIGMVTKL